MNLHIEEDIGDRLARMREKHTEKNIGWMYC